MTTLKKKGKCIEKLQEITGIFQGIFVCAYQTLYTTQHTSNVRTHATNSTGRISMNDHNSDNRRRNSNRRNSRRRNSRRSNNRNRRWNNGRNNMVVGPLCRSIRCIHPCSRSCRLHSRRALRTGLHNTCRSSGSDCPSTPHSHKRSCRQCSCHEPHSSPPQETCSGQ
jgi:hypothetical protein